MWLLDPQGGLIDHRMTLSANTNNCSLILSNN